MHSSAFAKDVTWSLPAKCSAAPKAARLQVNASNRTAGKGFIRKTTRSSRDIQDPHMSSKNSDRAATSQEQGSAVNAMDEDTPGATSEQLSRSGKRIGWTFLPKDDEVTTPTASTPTDEATSSQTESGGLPEASRGQVFLACMQTSLLLGALAFFLRSKAAIMSSAALHTDPAEVQRLLSYPDHVEVSHVAFMVGCAVLVSGARQVLLQRWPAFSEATQRSNSQVLSNLQPLDVLWVATLPGISEEFLFRGALIPALYPDWRGVLIAGIGFGALHNSGGRNWAFAGWASLVGILYGFAFLETQDLYVAMGAHSLANIISASVWLQKNKQTT